MIIDKFEKEYGPLHFGDGTDASCYGVEYEDYWRYSIGPNLQSCNMDVLVSGCSPLAAAGAGAVNLKCG